MNPKSSFQHKIYYLVAIAVLLAILSFLGRPATRAGKDGQGSPGGILAQARQENHLSQSQLGEIDPTSETIKLASLGMRGVAANILWTKANTYKKKKDWTNLSATLEQITKLQPNFISVWRFQAWNLSYNVSAEFDDVRQRYRWVMQGIDFLKRGTAYNEHEPRLVWDIGWFISQKLGRADERLQFRHLFKEDDAFHGSRPGVQRDNWLVGKEWFQKVVQMVDDLGASMQGLSPLIFRSDPAMCQMNYAGALQDDGVFGERSERAWKKAAAEWNRYGDTEIPTSYGTTIRLNEGEHFQELAKQTVDKLNNLEPGLREKIVEEKRAKLTTAQRQALDTPAADRSTQEHELAAEAEKKLKVTHEEVAARLKGEKRAEAFKLAKEASEYEEKARIIDRYRQIVNFEFWRLRADMEQDSDTLAAREAIYQGNQAFQVEADLGKAKQKYDEGLQSWRKVLDKNPELAQNETIREELQEIADHYRRILEVRDQPFPKDFILKDILGPAKTEQQ